MNTNNQKEFTYTLSESEVTNYNFHKPQNKSSNRHKNTGLVTKDS